MVGCSQRNSINAAANDYTRLLQPLLVAVMASLAKRLPIIPSPEQLWVATMRLDVVNDRRLDREAASIAHHA